MTEYTTDTFSNIAILVVEDDKMMQKLLRDMLQVVGFTNIHQAIHGEDALGILKSRDIDLMICDWKMHPMDGITLVTHLRTSPDSPNRFIPIIMLTGKGERSDVESARDAGVTEYIIKPFTATALFGRIKAIVETPRDFIISPVYRGPDRRRKMRKPPTGIERRKRPSE